jgi:hypothetical protein
MNDNPVDELARAIHEYKARKRTCFVPGITVSPEFDKRFVFRWNSQFEPITPINHKYLITTLNGGIFMGVPLSVEISQTDDIKVIESV